MRRARDLRERRAGHAHPRMYFSLVSFLCLFTFEGTKGSRREGPTMTARARPGQGKVILERPAASMALRTACSGFK